VPDIRGTWTRGPVRGSATGWQNLADTSPYSDPGGETYSITNQTGANFSVTFVDIVIDGEDTITITQSCSGTVASDGSVSGSCPYMVTLNGEFWYSGTVTLAASLVGNTLTASLAGQDLVGDTCQGIQT